MAGIVFLKTSNLQTITNFYTSEIDAEIWLEQPDCTILKHDNFLFGFCEREGNIGKGWLLTFFYPFKEDVDRLYEKLRSRAITKPAINKKYDLYQFFAKDPEERDIEVQTFLNDIDFQWDKDI